MIYLVFLRGHLDYGEESFVFGSKAEAKRFATAFTKDQKRTAKKYGYDHGTTTEILEFRTPKSKHDWLEFIRKKDSWHIFKSEIDIKRRST